MVYAKWEQLGLEVVLYYYTTHVNEVGEWVGGTFHPPPPKECFSPIRYFINTLPHITLATPRAVTNGVLLSGILPSHLFTSVMSNSPV